MRWCGPCAAPWHQPAPASAPRASLPARWSCLPTAPWSGRTVGRRARALDAQVAQRTPRRVACGPRPHPSSGLSLPDYWPCRPGLSGNREALGRPSKGVDATRNLRGLTAGPGAPRAMSWAKRLPFSGCPTTRHGATRPVRRRGLATVLRPTPRSPWDARTAMAQRVRPSASSRPEAVMHNVIHKCGFRAAVCLKVAARPGSRTHDALREGRRRGCLSEKSEARQGRSGLRKGPHGARRPCPCGDRSTRRPIARVKDAGPLPRAARRRRAGVAKRGSHPSAPSPAQDAQLSAGDAGQAATCALICRFTAAR